MSTANILKIGINNKTFKWIKIALNIPNKICKTNKQIINNNNYRTSHFNILQINLKINFWISIHKKYRKIKMKINVISNITKISKNNHL